MKASALEFRFRLLLSTTIVLLGFWSPWIEPLHLGTRSTTWLWLGFQIGGLGLFSSTAIVLVTGCVILLAALGATLRVWGTAYLGTATVNHARMLAGSSLHPGNADSGPVLTQRVLADGPYRFVRNPLYLGSMLTNTAIAVLMPPSGAAVSLLLLTFFILRLILAEESFLARTLGKTYLLYRNAVPRLIPSFRTNVLAGGQTPHWGVALLGEVFPLGVLVSFVTLSWQYNSDLLIRAVLVSFGLSLVARALILPRSEADQSAA